MQAKNEFNLIKERFVEELRTEAFLYEHIKTGARFLSLVNDDKNKVFGIGFPTPPGDSTGVAHIIEHSVLNGSRKYPVKDPFKQLLGSSVNTFLNAFTYPDKTVYPCASANVKDFYNLVNVYLDTVFYPLLKKEAFLQEGWHYEIENEKLKYKGVVFNEMKGAYSDAERILETVSIQSLFPDTVYGVESGGDPRFIPDLTWEKFKEFYNDFYHPSNSFIYFYGDDDPELRFEIIDSYLKDFKRENTLSEIPLQPRFSGPRRLIETYPAKEGDKGMVSINWMLGEPSNEIERLSWIILGYILIGTPASPLRKAILDSGLGDDFVSALSPEDEFRQQCISVGLKGIKPSDAEKLELLVLGTLKSLCKGEKGISDRMINAAMNVTTFEFREASSSSGFPKPKGLNLYIRILGGWIYGADPIDVLSFESKLEKIKEKIRTEPLFFEKIIKERLIDNTHRTLVVLEPDTEFVEKRESEERNKLDKIHSSLSKEELNKIKEEHSALLLWQNTLDSKEDLAKIPTLKLSDLDKTIETIPTDADTISGIEVLHHDIETNDIVYFDLGIDMKVLPKRLLPYMPLFSSALTKLGTSSEDYISFTQRIDENTGGVGFEHAVMTHGKDASVVAYLFMRSRSVIERVPELLNIVKDALFDTRFDDKKRLRQILMEEKVALESGIISSGSAVVASRLKSMFSQSGYIAEQLGGIEQLRFVRSLIEKMDNEWESVLSDLREIQEKLIKESVPIINITCSSTVFESIKSDIRSFASEFKTNKPATENDWEEPLRPNDEGLVIPTQVNYVGKGANLYNLGYDFDASLLVAVKFLNSVYIWDTVRLQGGAYGGYCMFDKQTGMCVFASYRDPNISETIARFDFVPDCLKNLELNDDELERIKISTIGGISPYMRPDERGFTAFVRHLTGITDEMRQEIRDTVFGTRLQDLVKLSDVFELVRDNGAISVLGSETSIKKSSLNLAISKI